jgi:hypothetical protein
MSSDSLSGPELLAGTTARAVNKFLASNNRGVYFEPYFAFDVESFIETLISNVEERYRIGLCLNEIPSEQDVADLEAEFENEYLHVASSIPTAVGWRDDMRNRNTDTTDEWIPDKIVILSQVRSSKQGSLDMLDDMRPGDVRSRLAKVMSDVVDNEPAEAVWSVIGERSIGSNFDLDSLGEYAARVMADERPTTIMREKLHLLKLFPDRELTNLRDLDEVEERITENYQLVQDIQNSFTGRELTAIRRGLREAEEDEEEDTIHPAEIIRRLQTFQQTGNADLLAELDFQDVQDILSGTYVSSSDGTNGGGTGGGGGSGGGGGGPTRTQASPHQTIKNVFFTAEDPDILSDIKNELTEFGETVSAGGSTSVDFDINGDAKQVTFSGDTNTLDVINETVTAENHGGIIRGIDDIDDIFDGETEYEFSPFDFESPSRFARLRESLEHSDDFDPIVSNLDEFLSKREDLLDDLALLTFYPMFGLVADADLRRRANSYVDAYTDLMRDIQDQIDNPDSQSLSDNFIVEFILQDTLVVDLEKRNLDSASGIIFSPIYPLHLWKYLDLANGIIDRWDDFSKVERDFISDALDQPEDFLQTLDLPPHSDLTLPELSVQISRHHWTLPIYTTTRSSDPGGNRTFLRKTLDRLTTSYPHARTNFRISIIDPVSPVQVIDEVIEAEDNGDLRGATVEFAFVNTDRDQLIRGVSDTKRQDIIDFFKPDEQIEQFSLRTTVFDNYANYLAHLREDPQHLVLINDSLQLREGPLQRDLRTRINRLRVTQHLDHDFMENKIRKRPAPEEALFQYFVGLSDEVSDGDDEPNADDRLGIRREQLEESLDDVLWESIAVPHANVDPFYQLPALIAKETYSDRNYGIYTNDRGYFRRQLRRIMRPYPIDYEDEDVENIIEYVTGSQRAGLLGIISAQDEEDKIQSYAKGILGSILGIKWLEGQVTAPKLIFSIDESRTRSWLNLESTETRADYFVLTLNDDNTLTLEVIEVKTYESPENVIDLDRSRTPPTASGKAVEQVVGTASTLQDLFEDANVTSLPRREALRDQIYYELLGIKDSLDRLPDWIDAINATFRLDREIDLRARVISVEMQNPDESVDTIPDAEVAVDEYEWDESVEINILPIPVIESLIVESDADSQQ